MPARINQAIARLEQDQAIYYIGEHCGHVLTYDAGRADARTWADYINVGTERRLRHDRACRLPARPR
ncbi:MAG: hypothetical protein R3D25_09740 [Geminicoccaceae bacterium]